MPAHDTAHSADGKCALEGATKWPAGPSNDMNDLTNAFALPLFFTTMRPIRTRKTAITCKGPTTIEREKAPRRGRQDTEPSAMPVVHKVCAQAAAGTIAGRRRTVADVTHRADDARNNPIPVAGGHHSKLEHHLARDHRVPDPCRRNDKQVARRRSLRHLPWDSTRPSAISEPRLRMPLPHLRRNGARPCRTGTALNYTTPCMRTGLAPPTSAWRLRSFLATSPLGLGATAPRMHKDWVHPLYMCTGTGLAPGPHSH